MSNKENGRLAKNVLCMDYSGLENLRQEWQARFAAAMHQFEREALLNTVLTVADSEGHIDNFVPQYKLAAEQCHAQFDNKWARGRLPEESELLLFMQDDNALQVADGMVLAGEHLLRKIHRGRDQWFWQTEEAWLHVLMKRETVLKKAALVSDYILFNRLAGRDDEATRIRLVYVRTGLSLTASKDLRAALLIASGNGNPHERLWLELHAFLHETPLLMPLSDMIMLPGRAAGAIRRQYLARPNEHTCTEIEAVTPPVNPIEEWINNEALREIFNENAERAGLTDRQAELFYWNQAVEKVYHKTESELAKEHGLSIGTVRQHIARAKAKIAAYRAA